MKKIRRYIIEFLSYDGHWWHRSAIKWESIERAKHAALQLEHEHLIKTRIIPVYL